MKATKDDIKGWLIRGTDYRDTTHVIIVEDIRTHEDFPVYVFEDDDVYEEGARYQGQMKVIEVYDLALDLDVQLNETRALHPDVRL